MVKVCIIQSVLCDYGPPCIFNWPSIYGGNRGLGSEQVIHSTCDCRLPYIFRWAPIDFAIEVNLVTYNGLVHGILGFIELITFLTSLLYMGLGDSQAMVTLSKSRKGFAPIFWPKGIAAE